VDDEILVLRRCQYLLGEVFVDIPTALRFLGYRICHLLNDKVKHDAVDYVLDKYETAVVCLGMMNNVKDL
jgi:hypothetical protein